MAKQNKVERVFVHCFLDGRDTPPHSGIDYLRSLEQKLRELGIGRIASLSGRYYAMDRDNRWERVERAYRAVVHGESERRSSDPVAARARELRARRHRRIHPSGGDYRGRGAGRASSRPRSR